jgi:hypothetical protein
MGACYDEGESRYLSEVFMIPISSAISGGLYWSRIPHKRGFELTGNGEIVGSLQPTSFWATEFLAETLHGNWKFRRTGCLRTGTEIVDSATNTPIAIFKPNWSGGGRLAFTDGQTFQISTKGFWRPVWTVRTESGQDVLNIHAREKTVEVAGNVQLSEDRLALLAIFAWRILQQAAEEAASTAAMVAVTG